MHVKIDDLDDIADEELDKKVEKTVARVGAIVPEIRERWERLLLTY